MDAADYDTGGRTSLDRQIFLLSQRLEKLKQIKAACLGKMFV